MSDEDPVLAALVGAAKAVECGDLDAAKRALEALAVPAHPRGARRPLSKRLIAQIFTRDSFVCRYCGVRTVPTAVLRALSTVPALSEHLPYHAAKRSDLTHPVYWSHAGTCDHVIPVSRGGDRTATSNLVTACWRCNRDKGDRLLAEVGRDVHPIRPADWDGLTQLYSAVCTAAGVASNKYHREWLSAFDASRETPEIVLLRLNDGSALEIGTRAQLRLARTEIDAATGGSSGGGAFSRVFGVVYGGVDALSTSELVGLAREAEMLLADLRLGNGAHAFLEQLAAVGDTVGISRTTDPA